jgi:hypothetical protein
MIDAKPPSEYDQADSIRDNGISECAECGLTFSGESGQHGETYTAEGNRYDHFLDTDPGEAPFFCPECWESVDAARKAEENRSVTEWSE